ncbi:Clan AD, family A22, presenilin-like aspartic peptidase [Trichomonas vaginalis G3]|uniref:Clan AD, family A22, presenilin-like aspartic peptidase n=1 Tax=Trichomonas vaginalis (strain ATCC PRA-98 / G3) TaxID=412133 RepID=A2DZ73_TRIV3|nr:presenilin family [Trichomonas vaginalis G3]EAY14349.1 Clan AD, family A22, presenilin-like aspartic peptidase [Trichomonas vaginalis G3]KAI5517374.1 presenilin family [Trichomonas vaginalis G3]|eukprot:XP_001326572.1 Clan AD, family A22, presenilin-like aspartic peptidase [Trichomonas vaginalis G3]
MGKKVGIHTFLEFYARKVAKIAVPVVLTLILDAVCIRFIERTHGSAELNRNFVDTMSRNDSGISVTASIWSAVGIIFMIIVVTAILLTLYYFGCMKIIFGWLILAVSLLLSMYFLVGFGTYPSIVNIPVDYLSLAVFLLNLVVVGNMSIFWRAPQRITQAFLVLISILTSIVFRYLPDWTVWILLVLLIIYDACVVLCPNGLLILLLKKSEERGDAIPALLYSAAAWEEADPEKGNQNNEEGDGNEGNQEDPAEQADNQDNNEEEEEEEEAENNQPQENANGEAQNGNQNNNKKKKNMSKRDNEGIKLGLGDFVFYGILVSRAARIGWDITILCIFAVILGLSLTLVCLAVWERPLPALPFSLALGIVFFIIGAMTFRQFCEHMRWGLVAF